GAGNMIANTATNAGGFYSFSGLAAGTYQVRFAAPPGYQFSPAHATSNNADSDADPATGLAGPVVLGPGGWNWDVDAGVYAPGGGLGGNIGDRVWLDADGNGLQDPGEPGLADVPVDLLDGYGGLVQWTTTDADGNYLFEGLQS